MKDLTAKFQLLWTLFNMVVVAGAPTNKMSLYFMLSMLRDDPTVEVPSVKRHHWTYTGAEGPAHWPERYPNCGGRNQSPIDILEDACEYDTKLTDFRLNNFHQLSTKVGVGTSLNFTNNGHSASVRITGDMTVEGGGLPGRFRTAEFHFHWGSTDTSGSEHSLSGSKYPLEMHVVNYAMKYETLQEAMDENDGLAVLGVFFQVSKQDNPAFEPLAQALRYIHKSGEFQLLDGVRLRDLLPVDTSRFYRYQGSLTTPRCYESVTWTLFAEPLKVSHRQLSRLRSLLHESGHHNADLHGTAKASNSPGNLVDNWRPTQPLNGRVVRRSFQPVVRDSGSGVDPSLALLTGTGNEGPPPVIHNYKSLTEVDGAQDKKTLLSGASKKVGEPQGLQSTADKHQQHVLPHRENPQAFTAEPLPRHEHPKPTTENALPPGGISQTSATNPLPQRDNQHALTVDPVRHGDRPVTVTKNTLLPREPLQSSTVGTLLENLQVFPHNQRASTVSTVESSPQRDTVWSDPVALVDHGSKRTSTAFIGQGNGQTTSTPTDNSNIHISMPSFDRSNIQTSTPVHLPFTQASSSVRTTGSIVSSTPLSVDDLDPGVQSAPHYSSFQASKFPSSTSASTSTLIPSTSSPPPSSSSLPSSAPTSSRPSSFASFSSSRPSSSSVPPSTTVPSSTIAPSSSSVPPSTTVPSSTIAPSSSSVPSSTTVPSSTIAPSSSSVPPSTAVPSSTIAPSSSSVPPSTTVPSSTIAPSSSSVPSSTTVPSSTIAPSSSSVPPSTAFPSSTIAPSSSSVPPSTVVPSSTIAPSSSSVPPSTAVPSSTIAPSSSSVPPSTTVPSSTIAPSSSSVPPSTTVPSSTIAPSSSSVPPSTAVPSSTIAPSSSSVPPSTTVPSSTIAPSSSSVPPSTTVPSSTIAPSSSSVPPSTTVPSSTIAPSSSSVPPSTTVPSSTIAPSSSSVPSSTPTFSSSSRPSSSSVSSSTSRLSLSSIPQSSSPSSSSVPPSTPVPSSTSSPPTSSTYLRAPSSTDHPAPVRNQQSSSLSSPHSLSSSLPPSSSRPSTSITSSSSTSSRPLPYSHPSSSSFRPSSSRPFSSFPHSSFQPSWPSSSFIHQPPSAPTSSSFRSSPFEPSHYSGSYPSPGLPPPPPSYPVPAPSSSVQRPASRPRVFTPAPSSSVQRPASRPRVFTPAPSSSLDPHRLAAGLRQMLAEHRQRQRQQHYPPSKIFISGPRSPSALHPYFNLSSRALDWHRRHHGRPTEQPRVQHRSGPGKAHNVVTSTQEALRRHRPTTGRPRSRAPPHFFRSPPHSAATPWQPPAPAGIPELYLSRSGPLQPPGADFPGSHLRRRGPMRLRSEPRGVSGARPANPKTVSEALRSMRASFYQNLDRGGNHILSGAATIRGSGPQSVRSTSGRRLTSTRRAASSMSPFAGASWRKPYVFLYNHDRPVRILRRVYTNRHK